MRQHDPWTRPSAEGVHQSPTAALPAVFCAQIGMCMPRLIHCRHAPSGMCYRAHASHIQQVSQLPHSSPEVPASSQHQKQYESAACLSKHCVQVTLIPRGQAKGLTWFLPGEDPTLLSKQQIFARVVGALGGRAAEEVIFGDPEVTTGASGDLQQVRHRCFPQQGHPLISENDCTFWASGRPRC